MTDLERCNLVESDCIADAKTIDGMPFTGRTVAEMLGNILAATCCLATVCQRLCERVEKLEQLVGAKDSIA